MKDRWQRAEPLLNVSLEDAEKLIAPFLGGARVLRVEPLKGGLANTNLRVTLAGGDPDLVLRLYQREPETAAKEASLSDRLTGTVPIARCLHYAQSNPVTGGSYALLEWVEGVHLDRVADSVDAEGRRLLGKAVGQTLAAIHSVTFGRFGLLGSDLKVTHSVDLDKRGLIAYLDEYLLEGIGGDRLGESLMSALYSFVRREGDALEVWGSVPCLVHSDFNGSNILVGAAGKGGWQVSAVLDWEFAFSGNPAFDLGNLLRDPLGSLPGFESAVATGYRGAGGNLPPNWRQAARIADLTAWVDFLSRPNASERLIDDARRMIRNTIGGLN